MLHSANAPSALTPALIVAAKQPVAWQAATYVYVVNRTALSLATQPTP